MCFTYTFILIIVFVNLYFSRYSVATQLRCGDRRDRSGSDRRRRRLTRHYAACVGCHLATRNDTRVSGSR